jgi:hypothetical protein
MLKIISFEFAQLYARRPFEIRLRAFALQNAPVGQGPVSKRPNVLLAGAQHESHSLVWSSVSWLIENASMRMQHSVEFFRMSFLSPVVEVRLQRFGLWKDRSRSPVSPISLRAFPLARDVFPHARTHPPEL